MDEERYAGRRTVGQDPAEKSELANKSCWGSAGVNGALSAAQIAAGLAAGSGALVADGFHSASDLVCDFVVMLANKHSSKPADDDHHYGHARYETAASLALGALLAFAGLGLIYAAASKAHGYLSGTAALQAGSWMALSVALATLAAKEGLFRWMMGLAKKAGSQMMEANAWHARGDALSSLVVAMGIMASMAGYPVFDPLAAAFVGFWIGKMGWEFSAKAFGELTDKAPEEACRRQMAKIACSIPGIERVADVRVRRMGDYLLAEIDLAMNGQLSLDEAYGLAKKAQDEVYANFPLWEAKIRALPSHRMEDEGFSDCGCGCGGKDPC